MSGSSLNTQVQLDSLELSTSGAGMLAGAAVGGSDGSNGTRAGPLSTDTSEDNHARTFAASPREPSASSGAAGMPSQ